MVFSKDVFCYVLLQTLVCCLYQVFVIILCAVPFYLSLPSSMYTPEFVVDRLYIEATLHLIYIELMNKRNKAVWQTISEKLRRCLKTRVKYFISFARWKTFDCTMVKAIITSPSMFFYGTRFFWCCSWD